MRKNRVVVDTNVLISAFVFGGSAKETAQEIFRSCEIYVSPQLLQEYRRTPLELEKEGKINSFQLELLVSGMAAFVYEAKLIISKEKLLVCRDKEDNMLLECCLAAKADFLVTGDKDLLEIKASRLPEQIRHLKIITPFQFLEQA